MNNPVTPCARGGTSYIRDLMKRLKNMSEPTRKEFVKQNQHITGLTEALAMLQDEIQALEDTNFCEKGSAVCT